MASLATVICIVSAVLVLSCGQSHTHTDRQTDRQTDTDERTLYSRRRELITGMQSNTKHELGVRFVRNLEMVCHIEKVERQRGQLAGVTNTVGPRTSADDHVSVADRLNLVDIVQINATVELRVQLVEKLNHLQPHTHTHTHHELKASDSLH